MEKFKSTYIAEKNIFENFGVVIITIIYCCFEVYIILQSNRIDKERENGYYKPFKDKYLK